MMNKPITMETMKIYSKIWQIGDEIKRMATLIGPDNELTQERVQFILAQARGYMREISELYEYFGDLPQRKHLDKMMEHAESIEDIAKKWLKNISTE